MRLTSQKRLAAGVLGCSPQVVWIDPARLQEVKESITKADIRALIIAKAIQKKPVARHSHGRARFIHAQKVKGRQRGQGSRKGTQNARLSQKRAWIHKVRAQRELLMHLRVNRKISQDVFKNLYAKSSGGFFRSRRHIRIYIEEQGLAQGLVK